MDKTEAAIRTVLASDRSPEVKARMVARAIRRAGAYRWVGVYGISGAEIWVMGWDGPMPPAHPRFSADRGLCGAAVTSTRTVIVDDVAADARYLTTFSSTRSEMVVPICDAGDVLGLIDIESDQLGAFDHRDQAHVERWGAAAAGLARGERRANRERFG